MTRSKISSWVPLALVALSLVPMVGGVVRLADLTNGEAVTTANARFVASPVPLVLHIATATLYSLVGAFQFSLGVRRRWPSWHRRAGRGVALCGLITALSGIWMTVVSDIPDPLQGPFLLIVRTLVGVAMIAAILLGVRAILLGDVRSHEAWMIRAYALGQGAGAQVLWLGVPSLFVGEILGIEREVLMTLAWLGNVALGEGIIRRRYAPANSPTIAATALTSGS